MNKNTFFILLIIGLLISNILLFFYIGNIKKINNFHPDGPKNTVINILDFNSEQIAKYERLITEHRRQIKVRNQNIISLKNELYSKYLMKENLLAKDSLIQKISIFILVILAILKKFVKKIKQINMKY
jgi:hypothetical protein